MEFNEKLQELRRQKGLTQEELAEALFVSRTAISKWESGRGLPNIDSLKAIAAYFAVSVDDLLSGNELLSIAEEEKSRHTTYTRDLVFGLLDCAMALLLFLPFFGQTVDSAAQHVSLLNLTLSEPWLKWLFIGVVCIQALVGVLTLALQNCRHAAWIQSKTALSLLLHIGAVGLFILSRQPYAAIFAFVFFAFKMVVKRP